MTKTKKPVKGYHRLTIDLSIADYDRLRKVAGAMERTASKQAKVMLLDELPHRELTTTKSKPK